MDEIIECTMTVDEDNTILIKNLIDEEFKIDFSSDIDFTDLVSILTKKIDSLQQINITIEDEPTDEKIKLVTDTIKEIFEKYNSSFEENSTEEFTVAIDSQQNLAPNR